jgi:hypothetical protein
VAAQYSTKSLTYFGPEAATFVVAPYTTSPIKRRDAKTKTSATYLKFRIEKNNVSRKGAKHVLSDAEGGANVRNISTELSLRSWLLPVRVRTQTGLGAINFLEVVLFNI